MSVNVNITDVIAMLKRLEDRLFASPVVDNIRLQGLRLEIYPDGSGAVVGDWMTDRPGDSKEIRFMNSIMSEEDQLFMFRSPEEMQKELTERTGAGKAVPT